MQTRDFTYVDNVVAANLLAARAPESISGYFNVACGDRISLLELVKRLNAILGTELSPQFGPARAGDVRDSQADTEAARRDLGHDPQFTFEQGLRATLEWYRKEHALLTSA